LEAWRVIFDCYFARVHCDALDESWVGTSFLWGYWFGIKMEINWRSNPSGKLQKNLSFLKEI
jgi:hypothetical protein